MNEINSSYHQARMARAQKLRPNNVCQREPGHYTASFHAAATDATDAVYHVELAANGTSFCPCHDHVIAVQQEAQAQELAGLVYCKHILALKFLVD